MTIKNISLIFGEDFDRPRPLKAPPNAKPPEPVYSAADLQMARTQALCEGHAAGLAEADGITASLARHALMTIAEQLDTARAAAAGIAEDIAEAVAGLLMDSFAAAFPTLCARYAEPELRAIIRAILPCLREEPTITVRVNPHLVAALKEEVMAIDPDMIERVQFIATDALARGDLRIAWRAGSARRDTAALWADIENVLAPAGLISTGRSEQVLTKEFTNVQ